MPVRIVRLGTPRLRGEGLRLGTVRRPPRGVRKEDFGRRDFFDVWLPDLAPSVALLAFVREGPLTAKRWATFSQRYRREMQAPTARGLLVLLAVLSKTTNFSVGCYCADETRCHRSLLRGLLREKSAVFA